MASLSYHGLKQGYDTLDTSIRNINKQLDGIEKLSHLPSFWEELPWVSWGAIAGLSLFFAVILKLVAAHFGESDAVAAVL